MIAPNKQNQNIIFPKMPALKSAHYVHRFPMWLVIFFRLLFGLGGTVLAIFTFRDWNQLPSNFRELVFILSPTFMFFAFYGKLWNSNITFITDDRGVFFPCYDFHAITIGIEGLNEWFFVPWINISDIRVGKNHDHEGNVTTCIAFDIMVSSEEREKFFRLVGNPTDQNQYRDGKFSATFSDFPLSHRNTVNILETFKRRHKNKTEELVCSE